MKGVMEFSAGGHWAARDFARAARLEQDHCLSIGSIRWEIYNQAVGDTVFHVLGDHGLVQQRTAMGLIVQRHLDLGSI